MFTHSHGNRKILICRKREREEAILTFKHGIIDKNQLSSWTGTKECCMWYGIGRDMLSRSMKLQRIFSGSGSLNFKLSLPTTKTCIYVSSPWHALTSLFQVKHIDLLDKSKRKYKSDHGSIYGRYKCFLAPFPFFQRWTKFLENYSSYF
jgi:hypothetical protein